MQRGEGTNTEVHSVRRLEWEMWHGRDVLMGE
jgi:hypothetical protein